MRNRRRSNFIIVIIFLALLAIPSIVLADSIILNSDLVNESNNSAINNYINVQINPYSTTVAAGSWQPNGSDYFWVSYRDTGYHPEDPSYYDANGYYHPNTHEDPNVSNPITFANSAQPNPPTATFYETFTLPYGFNTGSIKIWADDTARVYLNKKNGNGIYDHLTMLTDANDIQGQYCASGPIGCIPSNFGLFNLSELNLMAGDYQLQFDAYQRFWGPFGVLYTGSIDSQPIPEPSSLLLLASGALAICLFTRRR